MTSGRSQKCRVNDTAKVTTFGARPLKRLGKLATTHHGAHMFNGGRREHVTHAVRGECNPDECHTGHAHGNQHPNHGASDPIHTHAAIGQLIERDEEGGRERWTSTCRRSDASGGKTGHQAGGHSGAVVSGAGSDTWK